MGRDLKNRIGRRVKNPVARTHVLGTELIEHVGTACNDISQNTALCPALEFLYHIVRKSMRISGKWFFQMNAGDLPVTCGAVFSGGRGLQSSPGADGLGVRRHPIELENIAQPMGF